MLLSVEGLLFVNGNTRKLKYWKIVFLIDKTCQRGQTNAQTTAVLSYILRGLQLVLEINDAISVAMWFKNLAPLFNQWELSPKPIAICMHARFPRLIKVFVSNSDWLITSFAPFVIGQRDYISSDFATDDNYPKILTIYPNVTREKCVDWFN